MDHLDSLQSSESNCEFNLQQFNGQSSFVLISYF